LSAAVYGASEGLRTIVVDRETIGGQAGTSSLIRNYLGFPLGIGGAELCIRALAVIDGHGAGRLERLVLQNATTGQTRTVPAAALFVLIGAQPHTDWLPASIQRDAHGFILTGQDLSVAAATMPGDWAARPPLPLETSLPGVFAAGDVRHGSVKRVAAAGGEGGICIQLVHRYLAHLRSEAR
jgi:thioredoxin reductase